MSYKSVTWYSVSDIERWKTKTKKDVEFSFKFIYINKNGT